MCGAPATFSPSLKLMEAITSLRWGLSPALLTKSLGLKQVQRRGKLFTGKLMPVPRGRSAHARRFPRTDVGSTPVGRPALKRRAGSA